MLTFVNNITILVITMSKHPKKDVQEAIEYALNNGWRIKETGNSSHAYCRLLCPEKSRKGCQMSVWGTPKKPKSHARQIVRNVDRCNH